MKKNITLSVFTAIAFILMVVVNILAVVLPINGVTPGQVSDSYPNLFAPAGFTFSIWGLIYLLLLGFVVYQFTTLKKENKCLDFLNKLRVLFIVSSLLNTAWIFSWHYKIIPLSTLLIIGILICLILIIRLLKNQDLSLSQYTFLRLPFSVYFGWITVATIANITVLLVSLGFNGFGISEEIWATIIILIGAIIAILTILKNNDIAYGLVILWAYFGILSKHIAADGFAGQYKMVIYTTALSMVFVFLSIVKVYISKVKRKK